MVANTRPDAPGTGPCSDSSWLTWLQLMRRTPHRPMLLFRTGGLRHALTLPVHIVAAVHAVEHARQNEEQIAQAVEVVARRAERAVVALGAAEPVKESPRHYLNRLSDLLFVLSRVLNRMNGGDDVYWKSERMAQAAGTK